MKSKFLFVAFLVCLSIYGCRRVDITDPKPIANAWKLSKYTVNGIDKTDALLIRDFAEKIEDYDLYGYSYWCINSNEDSIVERGSTYYLYGGGDSVYFYASYLIPLTIEDTVDGYRFCKIKLLSKKNFTYEFELNGRLHEFQMVKI